MTKHTVSECDQKTVTAEKSAVAVKQYGAYIGLDVHKETIAVAVALPGREAAVWVPGLNRRRCGI